MQRGELCQVQTTGRCDDASADSTSRRGPWNWTTTHLPSTWVGTQGLAICFLAFFSNVQIQQGYAPAGPEVVQRTRTAGRVDGPVTRESEKGSCYPAPLLSGRIEKNPMFVGQNRDTMGRWGDDVVARASPNASTPCRFSPPFASQSMQLAVQLAAEQSRQSTCDWSD